MAEPSRLRQLIDQTHKHGVAIEARIKELLHVKGGLERLNAQRRKELAAKPAPKPAPKAKPAVKPKPPPVPATHRFGIDLAWGNIPMTDLKKAGVTFVVRYLSNDPSKNLHDNNADELALAGIDIVVVWETTANRAAQGAVAGAHDAKEALAQATAAGMPKGRPIYFAVDFDATGPQVEAYFRGAVGVLGYANVGVYAGYAPVSYLLSRHIVKFGWQTYAWSGGKWVAQAQLFQFSNGHKIGGVEVDYDHSASAADFGQWRA